MSSDDRLESQSDLNTYALIDAEGLFNPDNANNLPSLELSRKIIEACKEWGFFMITNHGFSPSLLEEMTDGMHRFFDMTLEEKIKVGVRVLHVHHLPLFYSTVVGCIFFI